MEGPDSGIYIPIEDGGEGTQVNFSQRMQGGPDLSLLPNHNYGLGRNSQDFGCRSQERGKVIVWSMYLFLQTTMSLVHTLCNGKHSPRQGCLGHAVVQ